MASTETLASFSEKFKGATGSAYAYPFWKARVALYAILRALDIREGDEVIVPGYTCVMNVNPIVYVGATPRYADIDPDTYNVDIDSVHALISDKTRVILAQHTYGIPAPMEELGAIAKEAGVSLVEDCCLSLGSKYQGQPVGTFGDAAYWSFQWNKIFTTGLGGMATTNDARLAKAIEALVEREAEAPSTRDAYVLGIQRMVHRSLIWPKSAALARVAFRRLSKMGLAIGSSDPGEFRPEMPVGFFTTMSAGQAKAGLRCCFIPGSRLFSMG